MNKRICKATVALLVTPCVCATENSISHKGYETSTINGIRDILKTQVINQPWYNPEKTLFLFDCEGVLIHRIGNECGNCYSPNWNKLFVAAINKDTETSAKMGLYKSIIYKQHIKMLVDTEMPQLVKEVQKEGIKCLVITAKRNESLGNYGWSHDIYDKELRNFGYDFAVDWEKTEPHTFNEPSLKKSLYYANGIMYTNPEKKSTALDLFLKYENYKPDTIIFMDDSARNLKDVKDYAKEKGINYIGIHYTRASKLPQVKLFFEDKEQLRINYLIKSGKWLTPQVPGIVKDEKGQWRLKDDTTSSMDSTLPSLEMDETVILDKPQGTMNSKNDKSLEILTQSPCDVTP